MPLLLFCSLGFNCKGYVSVPLLGTLRKRWYDKKKLTQRRQKKQLEEILSSQEAGWRSKLPNPYSGACGEQVLNCFLWLSSGWKGTRQCLLWVLLSQSCQNQGPGGSSGSRLHRRPRASAVKVKPSDRTLRLDSDSWAKNQTWPASIKHLEWARWTEWPPKVKNTFCSSVDNTATTKRKHWLTY